MFAFIAYQVGHVVDAPCVAVARYETDGTATLCGTFPSDESPFNTTTRVSLEEGTVLWLIREHAEPARVDNDARHEGEIAAADQTTSMRSSVGVPIVVAGGVWGAIVARSAELLPENTGTCLAAFTTLLAAAIGNLEARESLARLADTQAALRRVATLVAGDTAPAEIFAAVSDEVDHLFGLDPATCDIAIVGRVDLGPELVVVGSSKRNEAVPLGSRWPLDDLFAPTHVLRTGRSARILAKDVMAANSEVAEFLRQHGYLSQVASPIVVDGRLWGAMSVNGGDDFPPDTEKRLESFTELVATAIANAESREELARLAEEQTALRHVATLVAQGASPVEVFATVSVEVDRLLRLSPERDDFACVTRFDAGLEQVVVGVSRSLEVVPLGSRWPPNDLYAPTRVRRTKRSARIAEDDLASVAAPEAKFLRDRGYLSQVASPIVVNGQLWGAISVNSAEPPPSDTEARLEKFILLIATAIANTESREALRALADEQTALRHLATLVAEEVPTDRIFAAVCEQVGHLLEADITALEIFPGDGTATLVAVWGRDGLSVPVGRQLRVEPDTVAARILSTRAPARRDNSNDPHIKVGPFARDLPIESTVGAPILVAGRLWGALMAGTRRSDPWAEEAERRLSEFTQLIATAISNAESRDALARLADEQAALRRVATLVARDAPPGDVFDAVAMAVGDLLDTDITVVGRYDDDGAATAIGSWSASPGGVPVGTRSQVGGRNVLTLVAETEKPARVDGYDDAFGEAARIARHHGWRSSIAAPIIVQGRLWGVMLVATQRPEPFPAGAEERLAAFTDLVATALANAQAQDELHRHVQEQAALQRVATLVAQATPPAEIFSAVSREVETLFDAAAAAVIKFEDDPPALSIVGTGEQMQSSAIGSRYEFADGYASTDVHRTGRSARRQARSGEVLDGPVYGAARNVVTGGPLRVASVVASPLTVAGQVWGAISLSAAQTLPPDTEVRLERFADIVATAIANADSRQALATLAAEQASLRRIATQVAQGLRPEQIFAAVTDEIAALIGATTAVIHFDQQRPSVIVEGISASVGVAVGTRWELTDMRATADVYRTGRAVRVDNPDWSTGGGPAETGLRFGVISQVATPIFVDGQLWGAISVNGRSRLPDDTEKRMERFTELVATAIANAESKYELAASRRRIVNAGDEARRRIERNLHDGIQQGLIELTFRAQALARKEPDLIRRAAMEFAERLVAVSDELREVARGIHPTILSEAGLGPALRALARRSSVPVAVDVRIEARLPEDIEAAAYYIASEALVNVSKHSQASVVELRTILEDGSLRLHVRDNGIGGVDPSRGSGVLGIKDRVEALGGSVSISSPAGVGTELAVVLHSVTDTALLRRPKEGDHD